MLLQSHEHMSALSARDGTYEVAVGTSCGSAMVIDVRKASQGVLSTRHLSANSNEAVTQVHWQINAYNTYSLVKKVKSEAAGAGAGAGQAQRTAQVQAPYLGRAAEATPMQADTLQVSCCSCGTTRVAADAGTATWVSCASARAHLLTSATCCLPCHVDRCCCIHIRDAQSMHSAQPIACLDPTPPPLSSTPALPAYSPQASCLACLPRTRRARRARLSQAPQAPQVPPPPRAWQASWRRRARGCSCSAAPRRQSRRSCSAGCPLAVCCRGHPGQQVRVQAGFLVQAGSKVGGTRG